MMLDEDETRWDDDDLHRTGRCNFIACNLSTSIYRTTSLPHSQDPDNDNVCALTSAISAIEDTYWHK